MRRFTSEYLADTRRGMWEERVALSALNLTERERVLDVGCGTGALTRVLREESTGTVVALDADRDLLEPVDPPRLQGEAKRLPFGDDAFDLVVCQALLINLADPASAIREFSRVSSSLVAAVEPDNAGVRVDSTVPAESPLARRAREAYIDGLGTDVTLGPNVAGLLESAGMADVSTAHHAHRRSIEPPYSTADLESAVRKASANRLTEKRGTILAGGLSPDAYEDLLASWRAMGRDVVDQVIEGEYVREETVPFYVVAGHV